MAETIRILLVDDEDDFLAVTAKRLARRGHAVATAASCGEALAALERDRPDVVVLDVMLPGRDGIQCLKEIRRGSPGVAVILLTGHASIETGLRSLRHGASDYCLKPVDFDELVDRIEIAYRDEVAPDTGPRGAGGVD